MCWLWMVSGASEDNEENVSMKTELLIASTTSAVHERISEYSSSQDFKLWVIFTFFPLFYHLRYCKSSPTTSSDTPQVQFHNPDQRKNMILGMVSGFTFFSKLYFLAVLLWFKHHCEVILKCKTQIFNCKNISFLEENVTKVQYMLVPRFAFHGSVCS